MVCKIIFNDINSLWELGTLKLKSIDDLMEALKKDEQLELIHGEIVKRPMAWIEHGQVQGNLREELGELRRQGNEVDGRILVPHRIY